MEISRSLPGTPESCRRGCAVGQGYKSFTLLEISKVGGFVVRLG